MPTIRSRRGVNSTSTEGASPTTAISDRAIAAAKVPGDFAAVERLFADVYRTNLRWELVDVVFFHLQPQWMEHPPLEYGDARARMERATSLARAASICASDAMCDILGFCPKSQRGRVVRRLLDHFDDYRSWIGFLTPERVSRTPSHLIHLENPSGQCKALLYMLDSDQDGGSLGFEVQKSNQLIDFSVAAWTAKDPLMNEVYFSIEPEARCPILHLFSRFLFTDETRERIFDLLYTPGRKFERLRGDVVEATVSRCRSLVDLNREKIEHGMNTAIRSGAMKPPSSGRLSIPEIVFKYLEMILGVVQQLSLHPGMRAAFMKSTFYEDFTRGLQVWLVKKSHRERDREERYRAFTLMAMISTLASTLDPVDASSLSFPGLWRNLSTASLRMIQAGFVPALVEGLYSVGFNDREHRDVIQTSLEWLRDACNQHQAVVKPVWTDLVAILGESFWQSQTPAPRGWLSFLKNTMAFDVAAALHLPSKRQYTLCDNLQCVGSRPFRSPRACSGCEALVYCSQECQEADWKALHREECKFSRQVFHRVKNPEKTPYRQSLRQRHALLGAHRAMVELNDELNDGIMADFEKEPSILLLTDNFPTVYRVDAYMAYRGVNPTPRSEVPVTRSRELQSNSLHKPDHYLDQRIRFLLSAYKERRWKEGQRLVSVTYNVRHREANLLVMMQRTGAKKANLQREPSGSQDDGQLCIVSYCVAEMVNMS